MSSMKSLLSSTRYGDLKNPKSSSGKCLFDRECEKRARANLLGRCRLYVFRAFTRSVREIVNPNGIPRELRRDFRTREIFREALLHRVYPRDLSFARESRRSTTRRSRLPQDGFLRATLRTFNAPCIRIDMIKNARKPSRTLRIYMTA